jgi:hypothetical protein
MLGRLMVGISVTVVSATLALLPNPTAALADDPAVADLAIVSQPAHGSASDGVQVRIPLTLHNYGPDIVQTGGAIIDVSLPRGTEFWHTGVSDSCTEIEPRRHIRCTTASMIYPDDDNPSGVRGGQSFFLDVRIIDECTEPGEYRIEYEHDPDVTNNAAPLVVNVDDVDPMACRSATPSSDTTAKPSTPGGTGRGLPVTGASVGILAALGGALITVGAALALVARSRRRVTRG